MDRFGQCQLGGKPITIWVSHDIEWIQLHEPRFWRFIETCWQRESAGIIVARKIEPAVFALLKSVGLQGLQYHALLAREGVADDVSAIRSDLKWVCTQAVETIANHAVMKQATRVVAQVHPIRPGSSAGGAISDAVARKLTGNRAPTVVALLDWWTASGLLLPKETAAALRLAAKSGVV
jgi:hypothetical protein